MNGDLIDSNESARARFAKWITEKTNPLTSRVIVNRIWQHIFGIGIVSTGGDFGKAGAKPSHSELLDYLASEFVDPNIVAGNQKTIKNVVGKKNMRCKYDIRWCKPRTNHANRTADSK